MKTSNRFKKLGIEKESTTVITSKPLSWCPTCSSTKTEDHPVCELKQAILDITIKEWIYFIILGYITMALFYFILYIINL